MELAADLTPEALSPLLGDRQVRSYPALVSTEADALAWARAGAAHGSVVVADYQIAARGRAGAQWSVEPGASLGFSVVLRPRLPPEREGWLYAVAACAVADAAPAGPRIRWPDDVLVPRAVFGSVGVQAQLAPAGSEWAVVSALVHRADPPRGPMLARILEALTAGLQSDPAEVLQRYRPRCETLGSHVRARLVPLAPGGTEVVGTATDVLTDGALVIETDSGRRVAVRPQSLGALEAHPSSDG